MLRIWIVILLALILRPVTAGRYNQTLNLGDPAPAWTELTGTDDGQHSLRDFRGKPAVVVVFTCNSCPYAMDAEERLIALHKKYADQGVAIVAINANQGAEDALPAMKERAEEMQYPFPYLFDQTQQAAKAYGAKYTPEFYVLDQQRRVVYMGSLDDSPEGKTTKNHYVEAALQAVLAGERPEIGETAPVGCAIRYERVRRRRPAAP